MALLTRLAHLLLACSAFVLVTGFTVLPPARVTLLPVTSITVLLLARVARFLVAGFTVRLVAVGRHSVLFMVSTTVSPGTGV